MSLLNDLAIMLSISLLSSSNLRVNLIGSLRNSSLFVIAFPSYIMNGSIFWITYRSVVSTRVNTSYINLSWSVLRLLNIYVHPMSMLVRSSAFCSMHSLSTILSIFSLVCSYKYMFAFASSCCKWLLIFSTYSKHYKDVNQIWAFWAKNSLLVCLK